VNITPEITSLIDEIKNDKVHGASQLARQAMKVLETAAERSQAENVEHFLLELKAVGEGLMTARPAMAPVANITGRFWEAMSPLSPNEGLEAVKGFAISKADELAKASLRAVARIAAYGAKLIAGGDRIITHSYSSTVVAVLKKAFSQGKGIEVIVTRSGGSGQRTAKELESGGLVVTLIDDTAIGRHISGADKAIIGADRVCADGGIVNGIGSYQLALAAQKAGVPLYVLAETLKLDPGRKSNQVDLEGEGPSAFDITPLELVAGVVTEAGLLSPPEVIAYLVRILG
jgi:translation initiation factor 2B subunit (eIF-2B alpha/beta/delta family)